MNLSTPNWRCGAVYSGANHGPALLQPYCKLRQSLSFRLQVLHKQRKYSFAGPLQAVLQVQLQQDSSAAGHPSRDLGHQYQQSIQALQKALVAGALAVTIATGPALAADTAKVGTCLLSSCQGALAQCLGDPGCLQNLVCLQGCNGRPDETACQIRCGDLYDDKAVAAFNNCAVSSKKCVPQRVDEGIYPAPSDCALDEKFDISSFTGRWYITAGENPLFDAFDCQEHYFAYKPEEGKLFGKIQWRIAKGDGDFIDRNTIQKFVQDPQNPAKLYNHDNEYLHYEDDWYIIASKPDEYVFIYYKGNNDAWKGYGGATVYTRESKLPEQYIPELRAAADKVGLDWDKFIITDNTCPPHPPAKSLVQALEDDFTKVETAVEKEVREVETLSREGRLLQELEYNIEGDLRSFGRGFTVLEQQLTQGLSKEEMEVAKEVERELQDARKLLEGIEKQYEPSWLQQLLSKLPFFNQQQ